MKGTIVPIVIGAFGTITKGLLKGLCNIMAERFRFIYLAFRFS